MQIELAFGEFQFVKNEAKYWEIIRQLRNDPRCQSGFIEQVSITKDQQIEYMSRYSDCYYLCLVDGNPAGFIGVIDDDIRVCTHPDYWKKGVALFMVKEIKRVYPKCFAKVKINNIASLSMFEKAGYQLKYFVLE